MKMQITGVTSHQTGSLEEQSVWSDSGAVSTAGGISLSLIHALLTAKLTAAWSQQSFPFQIAILPLPPLITCFISGTRALVLILVLFSGIKHDDKS